MVIVITLGNARLTIIQRLEGCSFVVEYTPVLEQEDPLMCGLCIEHEETELKDAHVKKLF